MTFAVCPEVILGLSHTSSPTATHHQPPATIHNHTAAAKMDNYLTRMPLIEILFEEHGRMNPEHAHLRSYASQDLEEERAAFS